VSERERNADERVTASAASLLGRALQEYVDARQAAMNDARRELGVNEMDARALMFIFDNPGTRPTQLREHLGITSAGVTTLIDRLVQRGAVQREVDENDRRVSHISATVDLREQPWAALTLFDRRVETAISELKPSDADRFAAALMTVATSARETA
jgi:DNA-binding MarR family transcriptional regulator